jgi:hypothetical protein
VTPGHSSNGYPATSKLPPVHVRLISRK